MGRAAKVTSIETVETLSAALRIFEEEVFAALGDVEMEVRRAAEWVRHDRKDFWKREVRRGWERVEEAKRQLEQARSFRRIDGNDSTCIEEQQALVRAKRRLETARKKTDAVRRWSHTVEQEVNEYIGAVNQLESWLQSDLPKALGALDRMARALESYVALESPPEATVAGPASASLPEEERDVAGGDSPQPDDASQPAAEEEEEEKKEEEDPDRSETEP